MKRWWLGLAGIRETRLSIEEAEQFQDDLIDALEEARRAEEDRKADEELNLGKEKDEWEQEELRGRVGCWSQGRAISSIFIWSRLVRTGSPIFALEAAV